MDRQTDGAATGMMSRLSLNDGGGFGRGNIDSLRTTSMGSVNSQASARFESFTEAVPLSLSSMAHASLPLDDGVSDGVKQVLSHTLLSCVNYARIIHPPHEWTFRDLTTSPFAWTPVKSRREGPPRDLPFSLSKLNFRHEYSRNAWIYLKPALPPNLTMEQELENNLGIKPKSRGISELESVIEHDDENYSVDGPPVPIPEPPPFEEPDQDAWSRHVGILGRVSLLYVSTEPLTAGELDGTDTEEMPPTILYKVLVEYRSLPPTGNHQAIQAEELSMLSFGGSIDDDVKYGALASLYDHHAKYVLEIYSVRGKKYKFDLMDATLSDGSVPRLPSTNGGPDGADDPFVKSLCVTVTDHNLASSTNDSDGGAKKMYAITRMHLTLEGKPRRGPAAGGLGAPYGSSAMKAILENLPPLNYMMDSIKTSYLMFNPNAPDQVTAAQSGHTLILDPFYAGRIYVNGRYITTWGQDPRIPSHGEMLFGVDLHSIPVWHGRIVDWEAMKMAYGQLWQEIAIDARLLEKNLAGRLLHRLMTGHDPETSNEADEEGYDEGVHSSAKATMDCLESQILAATQFDRVGIAPKALGTRFCMEFGRNAFPCEQHEVEWCKTMLPNRKPVVVPRRLLVVLRRGGFFNIQRTCDELVWFTDENPELTDDYSKETISQAVELLQHAGCDDVDAEHVSFIRNKVADDIIEQKNVCRYSEIIQQYCVHEDLLKAEVSKYTGIDVSTNEETVNKIRAYLLGFYIAQAHPEGHVLPRYILRNKPPTFES